MMQDNSRAAYECQLAEDTEAWYGQNNSKSKSKPIELDDDEPKHYNCGWTSIFRKAPLTG